MLSTVKEGALFLLLTLECSAVKSEYDPWPLLWLMWSCLTMSPLHPSLVVLPPPIRQSGYHVLSQNLYSVFSSLWSRTVQIVFLNQVNWSSKVCQEKKLYWGHLKTNTVHIHIFKTYPIKLCSKWILPQLFLRSWFNAN